MKLLSLFKYLLILIVFMIFMISIFCFEDAADPYFENTTTTKSSLSSNSSSSNSSSSSLSNQSSNNTENNKICYDFNGELIVLNIPNYNDNWCDAYFKMIGTIKADSYKIELSGANTLTKEITENEAKFYDLEAGKTNWVITAYIYGCDEIKKQGSFTLTKNSNKLNVRDLEVEGLHDKTVITWEPIDDETYNGIKICREINTCKDLEPTCTQVFSTSNKDLKKWEDTNVTVSKTYCYKIFTHYTDGQYSSGVRGYAYIPPVAAVKNVKATAGYNKIALEWDIPDDSYYKGVRIERSEYNCASNCVVTVYTTTSYDETSYTDTTVEYGKEYKYKIISRDANDQESGYVYTSIIRVAYTWDISDFETKGRNMGIEMSWENPSDTNFNGVKICRQLTNCTGLTSGCTPIATLPKTEEYYFDLFMENEKEYCYKIFSINKSSNYSSGFIHTSKSFTKMSYYDTDTTSHYANIHDLAVYENYVYSIGSFRNTVDFGTFTGTASTNENIFFTKSTETFFSTWGDTNGKTNKDEGKGIAIDSSGNVYITGYFEGSIDFGTYNETSQGG